MAHSLELLADNPFDAALRKEVHPPEWTNPTPASRYNLVVLGGGTAGLVAASGAAGLGARVALIERDLLGGDCLNVGCVPSKAVLRAARAAADVRAASRFGIQAPAEFAVDFPALMQRMRQLRARLAPHDSAARFRGLGVDVFLGAGRFTSPQTIEVAGATLPFRRAVIATGARAAQPAVPGLNEAGYLTNETVFNLTTLPRRLVVLGAGPIGCELTQAFARLGSAVTLIGKHPTILPREDENAAAVVAEALRRDGATLLTGREATAVAREGNDRVVTVNDGTMLRCDAVLVCIGRSPNVDGMGLEAAGIHFDRTGVRVDDRLRTSNARVYAAGDVCSRFQFTHAADAMARLVIQNALFHGRAKASALTIPWCTYTEPELAHVGLSARAAAEQGLAIDTFTQDMGEVDRAVLDDATEGFLKVHVRKRTDRIVGATAVAASASALIAEVTLAMSNGLGLKALARTIHAYPTQMEAIRKVGDSYNRTRLTPLVKGLFARWFAWTR